MLPNMFKIAGELTPTVFHVAARTVATHALSIFGDHSDVMACPLDRLGDAVLRVGARGAGLRADRAPRDAAVSGSVPALLRRVSHLARGQQDRASRRRGRCARWCPTGLVVAHRRRALSPDRPVLRGSAQNPDVFFQAREACNSYYDRVPASSAKPWTASASSPGAATGCSSTAAHPMPSA